MLDFSMSLTESESKTTSTYAESQKAPKIKIPKETIAHHAMVSGRISYKEKDKTTIELLLDQPETTIGRRDNNNICLADENVSKYHAAIYFTEGKHFLKDLDSANRAVLNAKKVKKNKMIPLNSGDVISIGTFTLFIHDGPNALVAEPNIAFPQLLDDLYEAPYGFQDFRNFISKFVRRSCNDSMLRRTWTFSMIFVNTRSLRQMSFQLLQSSMPITTRPL